MAAPPVVLDLGASLIKVGFAGDAHPIHIYRSNICADAETEASLRSKLRRLFFERLLVNPRDRRVLVCENPLWPSAFRANLARALYALDAPAVKFASVLALPAYCAPPSRALLPLGKPIMAADAAAAAIVSSAAPTATTSASAPPHPMQLECCGLVVDIAARETRVLPVCDGYALHAFVTCGAVGVDAVARHLHDLTVASSSSASPSAATAASAVTIAHAWSDAVAQFCFAPADAAFDATHVATASYTPGATVDGSSSASTTATTSSSASSTSAAISISGHARAHACDALFGVGAEASVALLILECLLKCGCDVRAALASNLILCGGGATMPGLGTRLLHELALALDSPRAAHLAAALDGMRAHFRVFPLGTSDAAAATSGGSLTGAEHASAANNVAFHTSSVSAGGSGGIAGTSGFARCLRANCLAWTGGSVVASASDEGFVARALAGV